MGVSKPSILKILKKHNVTRQRDRCKSLDIKKISGREILSKKIKNMPEKPGVYRMLGEKKNVLYVGKAKNIKKRLQSYIRPIGNNNRITKMISLIKDVEITITEKIIYWIFLSYILTYLIFI